MEVKAPSLLDFLPFLWILRKGIGDEFMVLKITTGYLFYVPTII